MLRTLSVTLEDYVSPEQKVTLLEAVKLLSDTGLTTFLDELQEIVEIQDSYSDAAMFVGRIRDTLEKALIGTTLSLGVEVADEAPFEIKTAILTALLQLDNYLIPETIADVLSGYMTNEEVLATLVPLFTEFTTEDVFDQIAKVEDATIARLTEVINEQLLLRGFDHTPATNDVTKRIARVNRLLRHGGAENFQLVTDLFVAGVSVGLPLKGLLGQYGHALTEYPLERSATELLGLVIFSNTPLEAVQKVVLAMLSEYTDQPNELHRMQVAIQPYFTYLV